MSEDEMSEDDVVVAKVRDALEVAAKRGKLITFGEIERAAGQKVGPGMRMRMRYLDKRELVRAEFLKCATAAPMQFPTYSEFGPRVGIPTQGPWQPVLDAIADEEDAKKEPDITFVIRNKTTGYPSRVGRTTRKTLEPWQKQLAREKVQAVINKVQFGLAQPI
jgi:hypothetical protein